MIDGLYKITKNEVEKASLILGKAFHDGPLLSQVIPDEDEREEKPLVDSKKFLLPSLKIKKRF